MMISITVFLLVVFPKVLTGYEGGIYVRRELCEQAARERMAQHEDFVAIPYCVKVEVPIRKEERVIE